MLFAVDVVAAGWEAWRGGYFSQSPTRAVRFALGEAFGAKRQDMFALEAMQRRG